MVNNHSKKVDRIRMSCALLEVARFLFWMPFLSCLVLPVALWGQSVPIFIPEDFEFDAEEAGCICSPGVINKSPGKGLLLEYKINSGGSFTPDEVPTGIQPSRVNNLSRFRFRIKIPIVLLPRTKVLLGFDHFQEQYDFNFIQPAFARRLNLLDGTTLKSTRLTAYLLQSVGENNYLGVQARLGYNGNYSGLVEMDNFYRQIRLSAIWGVKKRDDLEWGVGVFYSENLNRKIALPFFLYNRTFNERWGIEAAFPVSIMMRYNFTPKSLLLFGPEFSNAAYGLRGEATQVDNDHYFRHTELQLGAKYERELLPWVWANVHAGLQVNFDSEYESATDSNEIFEPDLITGVFFRVGVFLSPPQ
ncbi:MAG: DUF6268 family outer membrane beta-barrel protein [Bacteroidota bacterium]